jgi:hypothetical protein
MANDFKHALDLMLSPFIDRHFKPRVFRGLAHFFDDGRGRYPIFQLNALRQLVDFLISEHTFDFCQIHLRHMVTRMQERLRQLPVIRQEHEAFRIKIKPAHRKEAKRNPSQKMLDCRPTFRIVECRHNAFGLIEQ